MAIYMPLWKLFVLVILAPAFMYASRTEGITFMQNVSNFYNYYSGWHLPDFLAVPCGYVAAVIAKILPGSCSFIPALGNFIGSGVDIGSFFTVAWLLTINPPFSKEIP
jgi:cytosine/uracil/thiamine/allantoin permease